MLFPDDGLERKRCFDMDLDRGYMDVFDVDRRVGESSAGLDVGCKNTLSDLSIIGRVEVFSLMAIP